MFPDGRLIHYDRYVTNVNCRLDFALFPFDEQRCYFNLYLCKIISFIVFVK